MHAACWIIQDGHLQSLNFDSIYNTHFSNKLTFSGSGWIWIWGDTTHPDAQPWKETPNAVEEQALALRNAGLSQEQCKHQTSPSQLHSKRARLLHGLFQKAHASSPFPSSKKNKAHQTEHRPDSASNASPACFTYVVPFKKKKFFFLAVPCRILVSHPGIKPAPPTVEGQRLNHRTTREVPTLFL